MPVAVAETRPRVAQAPSSIYCEVRRWAREVGEHDIAQHSSALVVNSPHDTRERFLSQIDYLITELEEARSRLTVPAREAA